MQPKGLGHRIRTWFVHFGDFSGESRNPSLLAESPNNRGSQQAIFISHSSADNDFVRRISQDLRRIVGNNGVWLDLQGLGGGDLWWDRIVAEITVRDIFLLVISPDSMNSPWVIDELRLAWKQKNGIRGKRIIPLIARQVVDSTIPEYVGLLQFVQFHGRPYRNAFHDLAAAINQPHDQPPLRLVAIPGVPADDELLPIPDRFIGRAKELDEIKRQLRSSNAAAIVAVSGLGGIGKTALAAVAVHELRWEQHFPDGLLVISAIEERDPARILREITSRFQPDAQIGDAIELQDISQMAIAALRERDALIVLDNVEPYLDVAAITQPLREAGVSVLVTSRHELPPNAIPSLAILRLGLLSPSEAFRLFALEYRGNNDAPLTPTERAQIESIIYSLGRHTLALRLAGKSAASPAHSLQALAQDLQNHPFNVEAPDATPTMRDILGRSLARLSRSQRQLFTACAAFGSIEFGLQALQHVAAALSFPPDDTPIDVLINRAVIEAQVNERMPKDSDRHRIRLHPLMYELAHQEFSDPRAEFGGTLRDTVKRALAQWYAEYCEGLDQELALGMDTENVSQTIEWSHTHGETELVAAIVHGARNYWRDSGRNDLSLRYLPLGLAAALQLMPFGHRFKEQYAHIELAYGVAQLRSNKWDEAEHIFTRNLELRSSLNDQRGRGIVLAELGKLALMQDKLTKALDLFQQALVIHRDEEDYRDVGKTLASLALVKAHQGDIVSARQYFDNSLITLESNNYQIDVAGTCFAWGRFLLDSRLDPGQGCVLLQRAANIYQNLGLPNVELVKASMKEHSCL